MAMDGHFSEQNMTAHPLAATLAQQREMIAAAGRKAMTHGQYMSACEAALRFVQSPELAAALAALPGGVVNDLRETMQGAQDLIRKARDHWDADEDMKVGKILAALSGDLPKYDKRATAFVEALIPTPNPHEADRNG